MLPLASAVMPSADVEFNEAGYGYAVVSGMIGRANGGLQGFFVLGSGDSTRGGGNSRS